MRLKLPILAVLLLASGPLFAQQKANLTAANSACLSTNCLTQVVDPSNGGATFTLTGTFSATVQFEASGDGGTTWVAVNATPSNSTTAATSTTSAGVWQMNPAGYTNVRLRVSSFSSGPVVASIIFSIASARANGAGGGGSGVTSIATTSPITGGTITTTGTIACATCATGPGSSTTNDLASFNGTDGLALKDSGVLSSAVTQTIASGTSTMGTGGISTGTCATTVSTAATGVATTDAIIYTPNVDPQGVTGYVASASGSLYIWAFPTAGHVNFEICNNTGGTITPSAITLNWRVVR